MALPKISSDRWAMKQPDDGGYGDNGTSQVERPAPSSIVGADKQNPVCPEPGGKGRASPAHQRWSPERSSDQSKGSNQREHAPESPAEG